MAVFDFPAKADCFFGQSRFSQAFAYSPGGHILRDDAGKRNAILRHAADDDKKQVEDHIQNACNQKIGKRTLCIAVCAEHAVAEIEDPECRHTERINAEA